MMKICQVCFPRHRIFQQREGRYAKPASKVQAQCGTFLNYYLVWSPEQPCRRMNSCSRFTDNDLPTITHSLRPKQHPHPVQSVSMSCAFLWFLTPACEPESFILKVSVPGPTQTLNTISGDGPRNFYCKCSLSKSNQSCSVISVHGTLFSLDVSVDCRKRWFKN